MVSKPTAAVEIYKSNPALYYDDSPANCRIERIASFTTTEFEVTFGYNTGDRQSRVVAQGDVNGFGSCKIGDIVNVSLFNIGAWQKEYVIFNFAQADTEGDALPKFTVDGSRQQGVFVITSFDGNSLVLQDYVAYMLSAVTIGYAGNINHVPLLDVLDFISSRDLRTFPTRVYKYNKKNSIFRLSAGYNNNNIKVSLADDITATNSTPYEVLTKCLNNTREGKKGGIVVEGNTTVVTKDDHVFAWIGARMTHITGRFSEVVPFILFLNKEHLVTLGRGRESRSAISVRVRPGADVKTTPKETRKSASVWAQTYDNSDNYTRLGVVIASDITTGKRSLNTIAKLSPQDYTNANIQKQSVLLLSYKDMTSDNIYDEDWRELVNAVQSQQFEREDVDKNEQTKAPNRNLYTDEEQYKSDKKAYNETHKEEKKVDDAYKKILTNVKNYILYAVHRKMDRYPSELLYEIVYGRTYNDWLDFNPKAAAVFMEIETGEEGLDFESFDNKNPAILRIIDAMLQNLQIKIERKLQTATSGLEFTLTDKQFFCTNNALSGWNLFKLDYDTAFGVGIHSLLCTLKYATFSPSGARYTLIECPFKDIHDIVYQL